MKGIKENRVFHYIVWMIIYLMIFDMSILTTTVAFAQDVKQPSNKAQKQTADDEKIIKLNTAIYLYKAGQDEQAKNLFLSSKEELPANPVSAYYLALIYTKQDNLSEAINEWKRYITLDPKSDTSNQARQYITVLIKEDARRFAVKSVKEEGQLDTVKTDENTVAVTYYHNTGSEALNPLSKGLAAMLITDISQVKELKVVEREKIQAIYDEKKLSESGLIEKSNISKLGNLLQARNIVSGSYADPTNTDLQITSLVLEQENVKGTHDANGKLLEFFDLEKEAAKSILAALKHDWKDVPPQAKVIHTKNYEAFTAFSIGLDYMDKEVYDKAKVSLKKAIDLDPNFKLAKEAYLAIPVAILTVAAVAASAASTAPATGTVAAVGTSSVSAGTSVIIGAVAAGTSVAGTSVAGVTSKGTYGGSALGAGVTPYGNWKGTGTRKTWDQDAPEYWCSYSYTWHMIINADNTAELFFDSGTVTGSGGGSQCSTSGTPKLTGTLSGSTVTITAQTSGGAVLKGIISGNTIIFDLNEVNMSGTMTGTKQ